MYAFNLTGKIRSRLKGNSATFNILVVIIKYLVMAYTVLVSFYDVMSFDCSVMCKTGNCFSVTFSIRISEDD